MTKKVLIEEVKRMRHFLRLIKYMKNTGIHMHATIFAGDRVIVLYQYC